LAGVLLTDAANMIEAKQLEIDRLSAEVERLWEKCKDAS
jgi:hypothetical protein